MKLLRGQERVGSSITRDSLQEEGRLAFPTVLVEETSKEWMPIIFFFFGCDLTLFEGLYLMHR